MALFEPRRGRNRFFCIYENKDADQLCGNREADQRLYSLHRFIVLSPYYLNSIFQASGNLLWLYSPVCVGPGRKLRRPVFSERGSFVHCYLMFKNQLIPILALGTKCSAIYISFSDGKSSMSDNDDFLKLEVAASCDLALPVLVVVASSVVSASNVSE